MSETTTPRKTVRVTVSIEDPLTHGVDSSSTLTKCCDVSAVSVTAQVCCAAVLKLLTETGDVAIEVPSE